MRADSIGRAVLELALVFLLSVGARHAGTVYVMRAIVSKAPGGPEVLQIAERPKPTPDPGEVLVKVAFAGVNRHDCHQRLRGSPPPGATDIFGLEISGVIVEVGRDVSERRKGEEVCCLVNGGGYAEYCVSKDTLAFPVPERVGLRGAAGLPEALLTVWWSVFDRGRLAPGDWVLFHGGSSGVGTIGIQLAKAFGARVVVTAGSDEKCSACLKLGADVAINYRTDDFVAAVDSATGGRGVDIILDTVGALYGTRNIAALAMDGRLFHLAPGQGDVFSAPLGEIMRKRAIVTGSLLRPLEDRKKFQMADVLRSEVWPKLGGSVSPVIDSVFPLRDAAAAHRRMESSAHIGKILLAAD